MSTFVYCTENSVWQQFFFNMLTSKKLVQAAFVHLQRRIQEFEHRGALSRRGRILRSGVCFDAPSHMFL